MNQRRTYFFDQAQNVRKFIYGLYIICIALILIELIYHRHTIHAWENGFAFYALYGFISCVGLVLSAKVLRINVKRSEDYYHVDD